MSLLVRALNKGSKATFATAIPTVTTLNGPPTQELQETLRADRNCHSVGTDVIAACGKVQLKEALDNLDALDNRRIRVDSETYASLLLACANTKSLVDGRRVHNHMLVNGIEIDNFLGTKLVSMYGKCGNLVDARQVFDKMPTPNKFLWNAMIGGYARQGNCKEALVLYYQMQHSGAQPDNFTFPCVLKACADLEGLETGKEIHDYIRERGFDSHVFVGNALIDMYVKCRSVKDARHVFDKMTQRDVVSWNTMITGCAQNGQLSEALKLFHRMQQVSNVKPNLVTITSILSACGHLGALRQGKEIHDFVIRSGFESDFIVGMLRKVMEIRP